MTIPLITAALLLPACGGDDGGDEVAVGEYASDLCTAFTTWTGSIGAQQEKVQRVESDAPPQRSKDALAAFVDSSVEATGTLVDDIRSAGTPDTENGGEAADALLSAAEGTKRELEQARESVEELPTGSRREFDRATEAFTNEIRGALEGVGDGLEEIDTPELDRAIDEERACQG
jgi:hypothetical protein